VQHRNGTLAVDGWDVSLHLVQRWGDWAGPQSTRPLLTVPDVTSHSSSASVPITVLLQYSGPLLCGFNVSIKGLIDEIGRPNWYKFHGNMYWRRLLPLHLPCNNDFFAHLAKLALFFKEKSYFAYFKTFTRSTMR